MLAVKLMPVQRTETPAAFALLRVGHRPKRSMRGRRVISERTKDGIAAARAKGKRLGRQPLDQNRVAAALKLVAAGLSPTAAARQLGLGRFTVYCEVSRPAARVAPDLLFPARSPLALSA